MNAPAVTVVVPVRDEAERLLGCLNAIAAQDMAPELVEVLVVDGGSTDATVEVAHSRLAETRWARAEVLHSTVGDRSSNLNLGLEEATAPFLVRVDARSRIPADYLRRCVALLESRPDVAVVGGRQRAVATGRRALDLGVARALNNRWGMGLARYRGAARSGPADTVYLGAYRTAELRAAGGWRADLMVNEDFDLNRRLSKFGPVWFDAALSVEYLPRGSLRALLGQYWAFGQGKAMYWQVSGDRPQPRQALLLGAPLLAVAGAALLWLGMGVSPIALVLIACAVGGAVEVAGSDGPGGGPLAHASAVAALGCIGGAWLAGVGAGSLKGAWSSITGRRFPRTGPEAATSGR